MDSAGGKGLPAGTDNLASSEETAIPNDSGREGAGPDLRRGAEIVCKTCHKTSGPFTGPVPKPNLPCSEERWLPTPSDQPQTLESPPSEAEIQDGGSEDDSGLDPEERLDGHNRPKRRLFVGASGSGASPVPQVCLERQPVRVPVSTIRLEQCTPSIYQTSQASDGHFETERDPVHSHLRRPIDNGSVTRGTGEATARDTVTPPTTWLSDQLGQVKALSNSADRVPGSPDRLTIIDTFIARGESERDSQVLQLDHQPRKDLSSRTLQTDWQDDCYNDGGSASAIVLPEPPETEESGIPQVSVIRGGGGVGPRVEGGVAVVDSRAAEMEWTPNSPQLQM